MKLKGLSECTMCHSNHRILKTDIKMFDDVCKKCHDQKMKRARTGAPLTHKRHDKGLTTEIGKGTTELFKVPAKKRSQFFRIRKWQKRLLTSKDRNMSFALSELQRLISYLGLPKTLHEEVAKLYEKALQKGLVRGRSIESIIAALVYSLSRDYETPRTLTEISQASGIGKRELGRTYRYISRKLFMSGITAMSLSREGNW